MTAKRAILIVGGLTLFVVLFLLFDPPPSTSGEDPSGARVEDVRPRVVLRTEDDLDTELADLRTATVRYSMSALSSEATHTFVMILPDARRTRRLEPVPSVEGRWEIEAVLPGDHSIQIAEVVGSTWQIIRAKVPGVTDREVRELGELTPEPTRFTVRITTSDGSSPADVRILGGLAEDFPHLAIRGLVSETGVVEVSGLPPGEVTFTALPPPDSQLDRQEFTVDVGTQTEVTIVLEPAATPK